MLKFLFLLCSLFFAPQVVAGTLHLVINGKALHDNNKNFNENNRGLGFEYDFSENKKWIHFINGGFFDDSFSNVSRYLGGGSKRRYLLSNDTEGWHIDLGLNAFFMTRKDYKNNQPFLGVLPFASIGTNQFAINVTYIPSVSPKFESLWFFQAAVKIHKW